MIPISPLTLETTLRYISAAIFVMFFLLDILSDPLDLGIGYVSYISHHAYWMFVPLLVWSLFDRWYFMASAMVITFFYIFFVAIPMLLGMSTADEIKPIYPITVIAHMMPLTSFGMYLHRNIKEKNYTTPFNNAVKNLGKKYIILFSVIAGFPTLFMIPYGFAASFIIYLLFYAPVALSCSTVVLLSFTILSRRKIAVFSVIPGALYFCYMLYEIFSGSAFGLS